MEKSCIHWKPVNAQYSLAHNLRRDKNGNEISLKHTYPQLIKNNDSWILESIHDRQKKIEKNCKKLTGRKLQKNATPIKEAVLLLKPSHRIEHIQKLTNALELKYDIKCFQIHIHRDEGKSPTEINHHAHLLLDFSDSKSGKMLRHDKHHYSAIQTLTAKIMGMERGKIIVHKSAEERIQAKHIPAAEYRISQQLIERDNEMRKNIQELDDLQKRLNDENNILEKKNENLKSSIVQIQKRLETKEAYKVLNAVSQKKTAKLRSLVHKVRDQSKNQSNQQGFSR